MSKVTRFPTDSSARRKNSLGKFAVPCQVSDRYLQFSGKSHLVQGGEFITLDVMTGGYRGEKGRKLSQLIVMREDLLRALGAITPHYP